MRNNFSPSNKAEQHAHEQTKINAQAELDRYREQLEHEKDMTVKGVIDEYMKLNLGKVNIYFLTVFSSAADVVIQYFLIDFCVKYSDQLFEENI